MKVTYSVRYDASVDEVWAMLSDPAFRERATLAQGASSATATVDGGRITINFVRPNDDVPPFARKLAGGEQLHATQAEEWADDEYSAVLSVRTEGIPAGIDGTRTLTEDGAGTIDAFDGETHSRIPLLGSKVEQLLADKLIEGWNAEHAEGMAWLTGDR